MDVNTKNKIRKRGRPVGSSHDKILHMRVSDEFFRALDAVRREMAGEPTRSDAIRHLVEQARKAGKKKAR
jgi:hypothetical protein